MTQTAGIRFQHVSGADGRFRFPETMGSGGAFLDYDQDGWLDLFLVNSCPWPGYPPGHPAKLGRGRGPPGPAFPALYRNRGNGTFEDRTRAAGLALRLYGMGCAVGDADADGDDDLLVTCLGPNRLFLNEGNGVFRDATRGSGLERAGRWDWHTSAAFLDYDRDGRLDLFVTRYVEWSPETDVACRSGLGKRTYCPPTAYAPARGILYRNLGTTAAGPRFADVSRPTGIGAHGGRGLGVLPLDENGDGWLDLMVANDLMPNVLFVSERGRRFRELAQERGVALAPTGLSRAGMGIDVADVGNDGRQAVAIGNFSGEGLALFRQQGASYLDVARDVGLLAPSLDRLTFGLVFLDADRDGWSDLFAYNGHVNPHVAEQGAAVAYRQAPQLFRNDRGHFTDVAGAAGEPLQVPQLGRGCARGDWDNDGRPDLLLCENGGPARLLRNTTPDSHHWLGLRLRGQTGNPHAYGAEVRLTAGGMTQRRWVHDGGSFLSHSDPRALFGLGAEAKVEQVEVRWPSGTVSRLKSPPLDRYLEIEEPPSVKSTLAPHHHTRDQYHRNEILASTAPVGESASSGLLQHRGLTFTPIAEE